MGNYLLTFLCNVSCALSVAFCGKNALETTNILYCLLWWFGVYFTLDLHVYLINYIREKLL